MKKTYHFLPACPVHCGIVAVRQFAAVRATAVAVLMAALTAGFTSCQFEDEDYFEESASLRVEHTNDKVQQLLVTPQNGWVMQYFCGTGVAHFEGFNLLARFEKSGRVTLASNHRYLRDNNSGHYTESSSIYEMLLEDGPVIALNTWNDILSPFVDPVSPWQAPRSLVKDGAGMQGDNNFVVMTYGDDEILLRGERYGGRTRLIPCDRPWEQYLLACDSLKNFVTSNAISSYYIMGQTDTLYITGLRNGGRLRMSERLDDPLMNDSLSAVYTPNGFHLERTDTIGRDPFQDFFLTADSTCLQTADGNVKVVACWDTYIISGRSSLWNFDTDQLSEAQKALLEQMDTELKKWNKATSFARIGLGRSTGSGAVTGLVVTFFTNTAQTKTNMAGLALNATRSAYGRMTIETDPDAATDRNMSSISQKCDLLNLVRQFAATLDGTYDITPDSYFLPTGCELQQVGGSAKYSLK